MRARFAVLYIAIGIALGLYLHATLQGAEAEWAAPSASPPRAVDSAYA